MTADTDRKNGAQHVYAKLKHLVVNYRIAPGKHLHPSEFVNSLKVSATPIRDAMHRLSGEQLLVFVPSKGFFSKVLDLTEMRELLELEFALIQHALATSHFRSELTIKIESEFGVDLQNIGCFCSVSDRLFERIAARSGNHCLTRLLMNLIDRTHYVGVLDFEEEGRRSDAAKQLQAFLADLSAHRISGAIETLQHFLQNKVDRLPELVKEGLARSHRLSKCSAVAFEGVIEF